MLDRFVRSRLLPPGARARHAVAIAAALAVGVMTQLNITADAPLVTWTNIVNATVDTTGATLRKTSGCDGCFDAGAASLEEISAGDGYVEFTVGETNTLWIGGLNEGDQGTDYADIDFAFRFNGGGVADVLENGVYRPGVETSYAAGDVFRIAVVNGRVQYSRNGIYLAESAVAPRYPLMLDVALASLGATVHQARLGVLPPPPPGGGLLEKSGSPARRPRFTRAEIEGFLPPGGATGRFAFPAPYHTEGIRLTNAEMCGGSDCLWPVGYSYWRNINNHAGSTSMLIVVGTDANRGGQGPLLLRYNKVNDEVTNLGPLFPPDSPFHQSTGEGWYFSGTQPHALYTSLPGWTELRRYDVIERRFESTPALDLVRCRENVCPAEAISITQPHSSDDDRTHSATVQNTAWERIGCVVARDRRYSYYAPAPGYTFDECHVDKSGRWLVFVESAASGSRLNRIVDLRNGRITVLRDVDGALGHLDLGHGYAVGADTFNPMPNATILLKFPLTSTSRPVGPVVHYNKGWDIVAANHVAHGNAVAGAAEDQYACGSNASRVADMADEIVCFSLDSGRNTDGSLDVLVVGQVMTDLDALGGGDGSGSDYGKLPKGNLDVTGRYFLWTTNFGGNRLDAVLVKVPAERLVGSPPP